MKAATQSVAALKKDFLTREAWMLAWAASVQRAKIYRPGLKPDSHQVKEFRRTIWVYVTENLLPSYKDECDPARHCRNLEDLVAHASAGGRDVLADGGYKFGVAQKLLNLFLKYLWCLGFAAKPPHCPVDRIILQKTRLRGINWTRISTLKQYKEVIEEIDRIAVREGLTIAEWELRNYSRR